MNKQITKDSSNTDFLSSSLNYLDDIAAVKLNKGCRPHSIKTLVITLISLLVVSGGILVALDTTNHAEPQVVDEGSQVDAAQAQLMLGECLTAASNAPEPGDPEFYPKLIANCKTQITKIITTIIAAIYPGNKIRIGAFNCVATRICTTINPRKTSNNLLVPFSFDHQTNFLSFFKTHFLSNANPAKIINTPTIGSTPRAPLLRTCFTILPVLLTGSVTTSPKLT